MKSVGRCILTIGLSTLFAQGAANASVIIGAVNIEVSSLDVSVAHVPIQAINQSGLTENYVNGITDFDQFTSTALARNAGVSDTLAGVAGTGSFYFDLGDVFNVTNIATWGQEMGSATMRYYDLYYSDTFGAGGSRTFISRFLTDYSPTAYAFSFNEVNAQYFEIDVISNRGFAAATRINEVVFGGTALSTVDNAGVTSVSEPGALALLGLGLVGLGVKRRKANGFTGV